MTILRIILLRGMMMRNDNNIAENEEEDAKVAENEREDYNI